MKKLFIISILAIGCVNNLYAESCGIPNLDSSIGGTEYATTILNGNPGSNESNYGLTTGSGQWATEFSYGTVWGMANCNDTSGSYGVVDTPTLTSSGQYCWCQVTGFSPSGSDYTQGPQCTTAASSKWMYYTEYYDAEGCMYDCAFNCAFNARNTVAARTALFNAVGQ